MLGTIVSIFFILTNLILKTQWCKLYYQEKLTEETEAQREVN